MGLEPTQPGFANRSVNHFGTSPRTLKREPDHMSKSRLWATSNLDAFAVGPPELLVELQLHPDGEAILEDPFG